ncbi:DUF3810 domain-containing protein [Algoriphagus sediminis]|uniref:DUF3810 domain-containing protein n=1 Tax=Algoriphagus sediminis TaxID=3057113 RepID=A0ABT7YEQ9_9BACT|nr:DUF3810 domain-containing protein [Algoriphagus sediminis]MDN3205008.1 DUF3810 domain-containing protein [Algoriphagus sediminis]
MKLKNWFWAILGLVFLGIRFLASTFPEKTEQVYSEGIFLWIRKIIDQTLGILPFPSVYFFWLSVILVLIYFFIRLRKKDSLRNKLGYTFRAILNGTGALVFFFLILWGFNYQRVPLTKKLRLDIRPLELEEVKREIFETEMEMNRLRPQIHSDTSAFEIPWDYPVLETEVRKELEEHSHLLRLTYTGRPRTKQVPPKGLMRRLGILGIYWPFTGESYIDAALHPLEKPFTIAHELSHSLGVTDEGEANFVAWVIGSESQNPHLNYTSQLRLLLYLMRDFSRMDPEGYAEWVKTLNRGIVNDILSIRKNADRYPPISLEFSRAANNVFLKTQGVKEGVKSYQQMPMLVHAWRKRN